MYIYNQEVIEKQFSKLDKSIKYSPKQIYYAAKANSNIHILKLMRRLGASLDTSSPGEIFLGLEAGFKPKQILFTGNNLADSELKFALNKGIFINADSLSQLEKIGKMAPGSNVGVRINPSFGAGYHDHVITAGPACRFGIYYKEVDKVKEIAEKYDLKITGIHQHIGSGVLHSSKLLRAAGILLSTAKEFEHLEFVDFGGGLGVPYKPSEKELDVKSFGKDMAIKFEKFSQEYGKDIEMCFEPGRFLVAEAGTLLARVTTVKSMPNGNKVIGINSGMTHLIRPALYNSYHEIENLSNPGGKKEKVDVVGFICESTDSFAKRREIAKVREGDILAIRNAGAYGMSMASRFNGRLLPAEVLVKGDRSRIIRKPDKFNDLLPK